jgi:hypothetical protein
MVVKMYIYKHPLPKKIKLLAVGTKIAKAIIT